TTTTAMVGVIFERAGLDPTVVVGGESANFGGTARAGSSRWAIAELDESDGSFLRFSPHFALITNIEADHLDHYGTFESILSAFRKFAGQVAHGPVVCWDDPGVKQMMSGERPSSVVRYAVSSADAEYCATGVSLTAHGSRFTVVARGQEIGEVDLPAAGVHNVSNALGAIALAVEAGLDPAVCCSALADFRGVARRLTIRGEWCGVLVVDDYAHHPTEIGAALQVGRLWANERGGRLVCVFQPHRYTRTAALARQFGPAFAAANSVIVTGIYAASEQVIEGVTGEMIAESASDAGHPDVRYISDMNEVASLLSAEVKQRDVVMTIGAGNVSKVGDQLRDCLEGRSALAAEVVSCGQTGRTGQTSPETPVEGRAQCRQ
ncbi:UDP-N-acetylmuramate--L-alanine ligase, partial [Candidatus Sumerlaeota bacterium]|nr:UDP-N-acetylmuramate--L-alanine ligase [Candidatus Sumerlaeota bacterium]